MNATILKRPTTFDRVDKVKLAVGQPVLKGDSRFWILGGPLIVEIDGGTHEVPLGFTTDGASIPELGQFLTGWDPWEPPQRWGAIVHDFLYYSAGIAKPFADRAFRAVLESEGSNWWQREIMYLAVRLFGGRAYRADQLRGPRIYE